MEKEKNSKWHPIKIIIAVFGMFAFGTAIMSFLLNYNKYTCFITLGIMIGAGLIALVTSILMLCFNLIKFLLTKPCEQTSNTNTNHTENKNKLSHVTLNLETGRIKYEDNGRTGILTKEQSQIFLFDYVDDKAGRNQ